MGLTAGIGSALSGAASVANLAYQVSKDQSLTGAEQEANAFNAEQAELNRKFQASEAEIARQWQEDQYLKYNSPSAQIQQYKDAGLNASLMYGSSTGMGASTSTSVPSGSSASSVSPKGGDVASALSLYMQLEDLMSQIQLRDAQQYQIYELTPAQEDEIASRIKLNSAYENEAQAHAAISTVDALLKDRELNWYDKVREAELELSKAKTEESKQAAIKSRDDMLTNAASRLVSKANAGLLDAQTSKAIAELGLIEYNTEKAAYEVAHLDGDRVWKRVSTATGAFRDIGVGAASFMGGIGSAVSGAFARNADKRLLRKMVK